MNPVLSVVLGSMQTDLARMDHVALNLANALTGGYKREVVSALPFAARVDAAGVDAPAVGAGWAVHTDQRAGTLKATGQALDVAIAGAGWFEVSTPQGLAYTRQGDFRLDPRGRLVTQQGHPVMGWAGEIQLLQGAPVIDAAGRVFEGTLAGATRPSPGATPVGQLKVVQFDATAPLQRLPGGLVLPQGAASLAADATVQVRQGFLENSNVSPMQEMVRLMETLRHMEAMQKVAVGYDEMLGTSIRKLGESS